MPPRMRASTRTPLVSRKSRPHSPHKAASLSSKTLPSIKEESASDFSDNPAPSNDDSQGTSQQTLFKDDPCNFKQVIYEINQNTDSSCPTRSDRGPKPATDTFEPPADHPPSVFAVSRTDSDRFTLPEHGPDLVGGKVSVDPATLVFK